MEELTTSLVGTTPAPEPYHKILGPYRRQIERSRPDFNKVMPGFWSTPEFEYLAPLDWVWAEKIDGTNVRIYWDGIAVSFYGRTNKAQLPPALLKVLEEMFPEELMEQKFGAQPITLYGEGYGGKIQKGEKYCPNENFVLFDVKIGKWWLQWHSVNDIAFFFGIRSVPILSVSNVQNAIDMVSRGLYSVVAVPPDTIAEGLVGVPQTPLLSRGGRRVVMKVKTEDFANEV